MNSLQNLSVLGKKLIFALMIISSLAVMAAAQNPQQEGKRYGDPGFVGEPINLKVVNADIREILSYITEQYGINFVIDKSVKAVPVTVNVNEVPWNVALDSILQSQELAVQVKGPILRVAEAGTLAKEYEITKQLEASKLDASPLYTEIIRLNYARVAGTLTGEAGQGGGFSGGIPTGSTSSTSNSSSSDTGLLGIIKRRLSRRSN